ncbi:5'-methylthioadenosine/S-adenosylhomocysteine nucleosidase [compost metagenome]
MSELSDFTPRGKLGHARVAVLTVINEEFKAAKDVLGLSKELEGTAYFIAPNAKADTPDVVLCQSLGRTNVPFSSAVDDAIDDYRPHFLLLVGIAGGLSDEGKTVGRDGIAVGDVLIADCVAYTEFLKVTDQGTFLRYSPIDHPSLHLRKTVTHGLLNSFNLEAALSVERPEKGSSPKILEGEIACGEKVLGSIKDLMQKKLLQPFDKALAIDMESYGMARSVCERRTSVWYNPRYAIIRGISDMASADDANSETRDRWKEYACMSAAVVAKEFIRRLPLEK